ncbi:MAG: hypothetical protein M3P98_02915 [bacterium]|nr:hypothetical protein [bacterium]MDQ3159059.1 hypothetical protein [bacterium]
MSKIAKKAEQAVKKDSKNKKVKKVTAKHQSSWAILKKSIKIIKSNFKLIGGISAVYAVLLYIFVFSGAGLDIANAKQYISEALGNDVDNVSSSFTIFGYLLDNTAISKNPALPIYQTVLGIIFSLAYIWSLREVYEGNTKARIRDALYNSTDQLVPFIMIMFIVGLQFIPAAIASSIYNSTILQGLVTSGIELTVIISIILVLLFLSLYLLVPSVAAIYIVTLSGATPLQSYRTAKKLVKGYRFEIIRKMLLLGFFVIFVTAILVVPLIAFIPVLAEITFLFASVTGLVLAHTYFYQVYRDLI